MTSAALVVWIVIKKGLEIRLRRNTRDFAASFTGERRSEGRRQHKTRGCQGLGVLILMRTRAWAG